MATRRTVSIDRGWKRISRDVRALKGRSVKVGLLAGGPENDGVAVVDYATFNEFGTSRIPARPFLRRTADEAERPLRRFASGLLTRVLLGQLRPDGVLDALGLWFQARVRATIRSARSWAAPNAPSTVRAKGSSSPLIDDGVMSGAVNYEKE